MGFERILIVGDSLADSGNALALANWYNSLPFTSLPDGTPTEEAGYFEGRFSNGYVFADLISNKYVGEVSEPTFPFRYEDPWLGIPIAPFASDPQGVSLNFAYGGAQVIGGSEAVLDMSQQVDALQDAVDGDVPPGTLVMVVLGGNDIRELAPHDGAPASMADAYAKIEAIAAELIAQLGQIVRDGGTDILLSGIADVGIIPRYDIDANGVLDATEQARADAATHYSLYLDFLIRTLVIPEIEGRGANVTYAPLTDSPGNVGALSAILPTLSALTGIALSDLETDLLANQSAVFMDLIHPNAQVHALAGSYMFSLLEGTPWVETLPMADAQLGFVGSAAIDWAGDVDTVTVALVAGTEYRIDMHGISTLGATGSVADPYVDLIAPDGTIAAYDDDSGAGFDSVLVFTPDQTGTYTISVRAVGEVTGDFVIEAAALTGTAILSGNDYVIDQSNTLVLEPEGGAGTDTIYASVSFHLHARSEIEVIRTDNDRGRADIDLRGNEYGQSLIGNRGDNLLDGRGGADSYTGGGGRDTFVLDGDGIDTITDLSGEDRVDVTQLISVASGTDVAGGGYIRIESGAIQVDADGGGDSWTTVGATGASGGTFLYLEAGVATSVLIGTTKGGGGGKGGGGKGKKTAQALSLATGTLVWKLADQEYGGDEAPPLRPIESEPVVETVAIPFDAPAEVSINPLDASPQPATDIEPSASTMVVADEPLAALDPVDVIVDPAPAALAAATPVAPAPVEAMVVEAIAIPPAEWLMPKQTEPATMQVEAKEMLVELEGDIDVLLPGDPVALAQIEPVMPFDGPLAPAPLADMAIAADLDAALLG